MRKLLPLILAVLMISCKPDKGNPQTDKEITLLKKENDSLKGILKNKFLFDHIEFRIIPSDQTPDYNDSRFEGNFVLIGFNRNDYLLLNGQYDHKSRKFNGSDTVFSKNGNYPFSVEKEKDNQTKFYIALDKTFGSKTHDSIISVPYESLWKNK